MRQNVDGVDAAPAFERCGDLQHAIALGIEQDDFNARIQSADQHLPVGQARVDERDLQRHRCLPLPSCGDSPVPSQTLPDAELRQRDLTHANMKSPAERLSIVTLCSTTKSPNPKSIAETLPASTMCAFTSATLV